MEQRSPEWYAARCGKVTASKIGDIVKRIRNGDWAASRRNYCAQLVTERLTGKAHMPTYTNEYMEWGQEQEAPARETYLKVTGNAVEEVGFVDHPTIGMAGASPDGLIGDDGLLEIKCLIKANHIEILLSENLEKYRLQMVWQMACTGRQWCDFVSYNPELPDDMQLFIKRLYRDEEELSKIEREVRIFLEEVDETVADLEKKFHRKVPVE
jgi:putative phage-type endonuclease